MLKEYAQIDENGCILENYVLDDGFDEIPSDYKETWNPLNERFYVPKYDFGLKKWTEGASQENINNERLRVLSVHKEMKDAELNETCSETILHGFDYLFNGSTYHFSYDKDAQTNFQETYVLFQNDAITNIKWTATTNETKTRLLFTKEEFSGLYFASVQHKLSCISHYRDTLKPLLDAVNTIEEITSLNWASKVSETIPIQKGNDVTNKLNKLSEDNNRTIMALLEISKMVIN